MTEPPKNNKPEPLPPLFSAEYHKARRQLLLWSAILFGWALIGLDLEKLKESGGNVGSFLKALKSPEAIPWAILILVFFFLYRYWVEWRQCDLKRRVFFVARVDFYVSLGIPTSAILLYFGQLFWDVQLADVLGEESVFMRYTYAVFGIAMFLMGVRPHLRSMELVNGRDSTGLVGSLKWIAYLIFALSSFSIVYTTKIAITSSFVRNVTELVLILFAILILGVGMFYFTRRVALKILVMRGRAEVREGLKNEDSAKSEKPESDKPVEE